MFTSFDKNTTVMDGQMDCRLCHPLAQHHAIKTFFNVFILTYLITFSLLLYEL